jgi:protein SCO1
MTKRLMGISSSWSQAFTPDFGALCRWWRKCAGWRWVILGCTLWGLAGCGQSYAFHGTLYDPPQPAPPLAGTNWDGSPFHLADQEGKVAVIFFGYSYCPDVCPLTLAHLAQVYQELGAQASQLAVIFVSTDPARDTPTRLAAYVPAFGQEFYGLHISAEQLEPIKKAYGVYAEADPAQANAQEYKVIHNEYLFVVDKSGALRVLLPANISPEDLLADLEQLLQS